MYTDFWQFINVFIKKQTQRGIQIAFPLHFGCEYFTHYQKLEKHFLINA